MNLPQDNYAAREFADAVAPGVARVRPAVFRSLTAPAKAGPPPTVPSAPPREGLLSRGSVARRAYAPPMSGAAAVPTTTPNPTQRPFLKTPVATPVYVPPAAMSSGDMEQHLAPLRPLSRELSAKGMPPALVSELLAEIVSEFGSQVLTSEQDARLALVEQILLRIDGDPLIPAEGPLSGSYLISGPAGAGKSVLIAHLAMIAAQRGQREVILVNTEGERLGAAAQMQAIGGVFGFQVINCYTPQELRALQARCGYDMFLLIEAAGWSPSGGVDRQRNAWSWQLPTARNVLCLPATAQADDLTELLVTANRIARSPLAALCKATETRNLLPVVSALAGQRQPVGMVASGPNLLDPIPALDLAQIVRSAVGAVNSQKKKGRVWC
ncbi:MAG TPA: hypothetical protein VIJ28_02905 [Chloroflexota bacterium]